MFKQAKSQASLAKEMFVEYLTDTPEEKIHRILNFRQRRLFIMNRQGRFVLFIINRESESYIVVYSKSRKRELKAKLMNESVR